MPKKVNSPVNSRELSREVRKQFPLSDEVLDKDGMKKARELNANIIANVLALEPYKYTNTENIDLLKKRFFAYLTMCAEQGVKPGNEGAYLAMGISRATIQSWAKGEKSKIKQEFAEQTISALEAIRESATQEGLINFIYSIFKSKAETGLVEKKESIVTIKHDLYSSQSALEYARKLGMSTQDTSEDVQDNMFEKNIINADFREIEDDNLDDLPSLDELPFD